MLNGPDKQIQIRKQSATDFSYITSVISLITTWSEIIVVKASSEKYI